MNRPTGTIPASRPLPLVTVHGAARAVVSAVYEGDSPIFAAETVDDWARTPFVPRKLGQSPENGYYRSKSSRQPAMSAVSWSPANTTTRYRKVSGLSAAIGMSPSNANGVGDMNP